MDKYFEIPEYFVECKFEEIYKEQKDTAQHLAHCIKTVFENITSILDVGCGPGVYVDALTNIGFDTKGIDIDPRIKDKPNIFWLDFLSPNVEFNGKVSLIITTEVAEHLPESLAKLFVERLCSLSDKILFSAAQPGQGGTNHINCQPKTYWEELFKEHEFIKNKEKEEKMITLLKDGQHMIWLLNNLQIFFKNQNINQTLD